MTPYATKDATEIAENCAASASANAPRSYVGFGLTNEDVTWWTLHVVTELQVLRKSDRLEQHVDIDGFEHLRKPNDDAE